MNIKFTFKKTILLAFSYILLAGLQMINAQTNNVGINTTTPDASAALDVVSTTQGMLVPRMTAAQRGFISSPATGLMVYQSDAPAGFYFYNGTAWTQLGAMGPQGFQGPQGTQGTTGSIGPQGNQGLTGPAGQGVPTGGTTNQVLAKIDGTNYNTQWVTPATGGADNLGNHTATQALNMNSNAITGATNITATGTATLGGNAYPTNTGTNGQFLRTNGAGALSWGSGGGASLQLSVSKSAAAAQTTNIGSSLSLPDVITFDNVATNPTLGTWTGNNTYTVGAGGAGVYLIDVSFISNQSFGSPMIDMNGTGNSGSSIYGTGLIQIQTAQSPHKGRGHLTTIVNLSVGDFFLIRGTPQSTIVGVDLSTDGSTFLRIVKLN